MRRPRDSDRHQSEGWLIVTTEANRNVIRIARGGRAIQ